MGFTLISPTKALLLARLRAAATDILKPSSRFALPQGMFT
jgi:hypothetical protein